MEVFPPTFFIIHNLRKKQSKIFFRQECGDKKFLTRKTDYESSDQYIVPSHVPISKFKIENLKFLLPRFCQVMIRLKEEPFRYPFPSFPPLIRICSFPTDNLCEVSIIARYKAKKRRCVKLTRCAWPRTIRRKEGPIPQGFFCGRHRGPGFNVSGSFPKSVT